MKKLITLMGILVSGFSYSQNITSIDLTEYGKPIYMTPKAGSCGSPDGAMNPIGAPPPSYAWLQANGYCNPNSYGTNPTVCWTFTPTSSSVTINSGYSVSGCVNVGFGPFVLYNAGCTQIGTGLTFTGLTPGLQYTWCMTGSASGGGPGCTGFDDFCPYYTNNVVLPVELEEFTGTNLDGANHLTWSTLSETNNSHFTIERSADAKEWLFMGYIPGSGSTVNRTKYEWYDYENIDRTYYYRLTQTDFDGASESFKIISVVANPHAQETPTAYDTSGRVIEHPENYRGVIIYKYKNGFWYKVTRLRK